MAEIKVITIQAGEEFLAALTKLLGGEAAQEVKAAVEAAGVVLPEEPAAGPCDCEDCCEDEDVIPEPEFDFGQVISEGLEESEDCFQKTFKVEAAMDLDVQVEATGVVVTGTNTEGVEFSDTIAPYGAFDEVTAYFDDVDETLNVTLWKVSEGGTEVEIEGW